MQNIQSNPSILHNLLKHKEVFKYFELYLLCEVRCTTHVTHVVSKFFQLLIHADKKFKLERNRLYKVKGQAAIPALQNSQQHYYQHRLKNV